MKETGRLRTASDVEINLQVYAFPESKRGINYSEQAKKVYDFIDQYSSHAFFHELTLLFKNTEGTQQ